MRKISPLMAVIALCCLAFFAGCSQQKSAEREANEQQPSSSTQQTREAPEQQPSGDQRFLVEASQDGKAEIELGQVAASRAASPSVKKLAQKIVSDHTKANQQLESLPQASQALQSAGVPQEKSNTIDRLSQLSGKEFDQAFVEQLVQDHESAITQFKQAAASAQDPGVKQFASKTLPTLEQHLQMAKALQGGKGQH